MTLDFCLRRNDKGKESRNNTKMGKDDREERQKQQRGDGNNRSVTK